MTGFIINIPKANNLHLCKQKKKTKGNTER